MLFNLTSPLPPNIGLTGKGLAGTMDMDIDHFIAEGIPLTEFDDDDHANGQPCQLAGILVTDSGGVELARNQVIVPVSTEIRCDYYHADREFDISTGRVETNKLTLHDDENQDEYPGGNQPLMSRRPVLCAECHASNALGALGEPGIPNLSQAMHENHAGKVQDSTHAIATSSEARDAIKFVNLQGHFDRMHSVPHHRTNRGRPTPLI